MYCIFERLDFIVKAKNRHFDQSCCAGYTESIKTPNFSLRFPIPKHFLKATNCRIEIIIIKKNVIMLYRTLKSFYILNIFGAGKYNETYNLPL
jgi:hypothetical protein